MRYSDGASTFARKSTPKLCEIYLICKSTSGLCTPGLPGFYFAYACASFASENQTYNAGNRGFLSD